jgi:anti-anti-sigma factor
MKTHPNHSDGIALYKLENNLCAGQAKDLEDGIQKLIDAHTPDPCMPRPLHQPAEPLHLLIDLSKVALIDSTGLGALIRSEQKITRKGGYVFLVGLQSEPRMVMEITHTIRLFHVFESAEAALASFRQILFTKKQLKGLQLGS